MTQRKRFNGQSGVLSASIASSGATSFSSAALAAFPAITGTDYAVVVLDPEGAGGAPEIAYITAHTAAATSATISRGQEGTAARTHALAITWEHVPTVLDWEDMLVDGTTLEVVAGVHQIKDGGVSSAKIADGTIVTGDLADNSVTAAKIVDGNVGTAELAANAVTSAKIAAGAVTSSQASGFCKVVGYSGATDGTQDIIIGHGLGFVPSAAFIQSFSPSGGSNQGYPVVTSVDSLFVYARYMNTAGSMAGVSVSGRVVVFY